MLVAEHLDFDVAGVDDELLDEDAVVPERGLRLRARPGEAFRDFVAGTGNPHALAAAAGGGLDHHGVADLVGDLDRVQFVLDDPEMAGNGRDLGGGRRLLAFDLVAHGGDRLGIGADEDDPRLGQRHRKRLALGQEAVAGMHRLGPARPAGRDDLVDDEIALGGLRRPDVDGAVGHFHMEGILVGVGIDRDGLNPHAARGLDDATGDFAAIGDQNALEHAVQLPRNAGILGFAASARNCQCDLGLLSLSNEGLKREIGDDGGGPIARRRRAPAGRRRPPGCQWACDRFRLGTWETIQFKISVSTSASAQRGAQDENHVVGASAIWPGADAVNSRSKRSSSAAMTAESVIPERAMALIKVL